MATMPDGFSALQAEGIVYLPIGTLDELRKEGINPKEVACCAPTQQGIIRGCAMADKCRFYMQRRGGFKFKPGSEGGMRYVGYRLITTEGRAKEDYMSCYAYTATMQDREDHGALMRQKTGKGEIIGVIAQEGEKIVRRVRVPKNEADKSLTADYKFVTEEVTIPHWPRPGEIDATSYDQSVIARERERMKQEEQAMSQAFESMKAEAVPEDDDADWGSGADATLELGDGKDPAP